MKGLVQRIFRGLLVSIMGMIMLLTGLISAPIPVYAESENEYDHTQVEDDLKDVDL